MTGSYFWSLTIIYYLHFPSSFKNELASWNISFYISFELDGGYLKWKYVSIIYYIR